MYNDNLADLFYTNNYCFYSRCLDENEYRRYPTHELLIHPFITPSPLETFSAIPPLRNEGRTQAVHTPGITNGKHYTMYVTTQLYVYEFHTYMYI